MPAKANAEWQGDLRSGSGTFTAGDTIHGGYSFRSRFEDGPGANPEQLIGAAHAACFSMALSNALAQAGTPVESVQHRRRRHDAARSTARRRSPRSRCTPWASFPASTRPPSASSPAGRQDRLHRQPRLAGVPEITLEATLAGLKREAGAGAHRAPGVAARAVSARRAPCETAARDRAGTGTRRRSLASASTSPSIGGGITGAGVALDAASRGYSVALLERADYACGDHRAARASSSTAACATCSSFDLGLVREALLERQLMVALAPHLVRPLPIVVPAFDGARLDRLVGVGLNLYDVMAGRAAARAPRGRAGAGRRGGWSPDRHRVISGEEVIELLPGARARASRPPATSSTTARPTTSASS